MAAKNGNLISDSLLRELKNNIKTVRNDQNVYNNDLIGRSQNQTMKNVQITGSPETQWTSAGYTGANGFYSGREVVLSGYTSSIGYISGASWATIDENIYGGSLSSSFPPICNIFEIDRDVLSGVPLSTTVEVYSYGDLSGNTIWYFTNENIILQHDVLTDMTVSGKTASQILSAPITWNYNTNYDALSASKITFVQSLSFSPDLSAFLSFSRDMTIDNFGKMISVTKAVSSIVVSTQNCT